MIIAVKYDLSEARTYDDSQHKEALSFIVSDGYLVEVAHVTDYVDGGPRV